MDPEQATSSVAEFIIAFCQPKNLCDLLVHANITPKISDPLGNSHCKARRCKTCPILVTTNTFYSSVTGERFKTKLGTSGKTSNVTNLIQCRSCGLQYVGETRQSLQSWINSHCFNISHNCINESPVEAHFTSEGHTEVDLLVMIINKFWKEDAILRKIRERADE